MGIQARHISTPSGPGFKSKMHFLHEPAGSFSFSFLRFLFCVVWFTLPHPPACSPFVSRLKSFILMDMDRANIVIIGGGVVGCAVARAVSQRWSDVFLVEQMPRFGMGASTRNSGVIHSGIYYPPGSLKAQLCVQGNRMLHEFCAEYNVPHRNCGKLVVAHDVKQEAELELLASIGSANGVPGLRIVDRVAVHAREPHIEAAFALEVPSTGIISAEDLIKTLARMATDQGELAHTHTRHRVGPAR